MKKDKLRLGDFIQATLEKPPQVDPLPEFPDAQLPKLYVPTSPTPPSSLEHLHELQKEYQDKLDEIYNYFFKVANVGYGSSPIDELTVTDEVTAVKTPYPNSPSSDYPITGLDDLRLNENIVTGLGYNIELNETLGVTTSSVADEPLKTEEPPSRAFSSFLSPYSIVFGTQTYRRFTGYYDPCKALKERSHGKRSKKSWGRRVTRQQAIRITYYNRSHCK